MNKTITGLAIAAVLLVPKPAGAVNIGAWWTALTPASKAVIAGAIVVAPVVLWGINRANHSGQQSPPTQQQGHPTLVNTMDDDSYLKVRWSCVHEALDGSGCDAMQRVLVTPDAP